MTEATGQFRIEVRSYKLNVLVVDDALATVGGVHNYLALVDSSGKTVGQIHGFATKK